MKEENSQLSTRKAAFSFTFSHGLISFQIYNEIKDFVI